MLEWLPKAQRHLLRAPLPDPKRRLAEAPWAPWAAVVQLSAGGELLRFLSVRLGKCMNEILICCSILQCIAPGNSIQNSNPPQDPEPLSRGGSGLWGISAAAERHGQLWVSSIYCGKMAASGAPFRPPSLSSSRAPFRPHLLRQARCECIPQIGRAHV